MTMWSGDFEIAPGELFGEWLRAEIESNAVLERNGPMLERVQSAAERLQRHRPLDERFLVEVPWLDAPNAFAAPGRYIYFSRRLLERCPHEDAAAFVVAHEIAHHDLGHFTDFERGFARRAARFQAGVFAILFFRVLQRHIYNPERELEADRRAIELCITAGYSPAKCLYLFHILELIALDYGDLGAVYGLDPECDDELSADASIVTRARIWLYQRKRGYLPIQDRRAELQRYVKRTMGLDITPRGA